MIAALHFGLDGTGQLGHVLLLVDLNRLTCCSMAALISGLKRNHIKTLQIVTYAKLFMKNWVDIYHICLLLLFIS